MSVHLLKILCKSVDTVSEEERVASYKSVLLYVIDMVQLFAVYTLAARWQ